MKIKLGPYPKKGYRKVDIHIDHYDTWNMDNTLASIIYPMLIQLKATKHGVPSEFAEVGGESYESQDSFDFYKENTDKLFEEKNKEWDDILDKMIWSFQQLAHDNYDDKYHHGTPKYDWEETDTLYPNPVTGKPEPTYKMVDKNPDEHWYDHIGHKLHEDRMQEGFELFGKYFRSLWD